MRHLMKYSKYNVHGPLGRNRVRIYHTVGVDVDVATQRRNVRSYTTEKARSDVQDCVDEFNIDDINEMIDLLGTRYIFLFCFVVIIMKCNVVSSTWLLFHHLFSISNALLYE